VIAADETVAELGHDAGPSRVQAVLIRASVAISLSPIYFTFVYFAICFVLLPFVRKHVLDMSLLLSGIGYELALFFIAQTPDIRYSQWMAICSLVVLSLVIGRRLASDATARS